MAKLSIKLFRKQAELFAEGAKKTLVEALQKSEQINSARFNLLMGTAVRTDNQRPGYTKSDIVISNASNPNETISIIMAAAYDPQTTDSSMGISIAQNGETTGSGGIYFSGKAAANAVGGLAELISKDPSLKALFVSYNMIYEDVYGITGMDGMLRDLESLTFEEINAMNLTFKILLGDNYSGIFIFEDISPGGLRHEYTEMTSKSIIIEDSYTSNLELIYSRAPDLDSESIDVSGSYNYSHVKNG